MYNSCPEESEPYDAIDRAVLDIVIDTLHRVDAVIQPFRLENIMSTIFFRKIKI